MVLVEVDLFHWGQLLLCCYALLQPRQMAYQEETMAHKRYTCRSKYGDHSCYAFFWVCAEDVVRYSW